MWLTMASSSSSRVKILPRSSGAGANIRNSISIFSHNVLLPNSVDGWWVYKMYSARHKLPSSSACSWKSRSQVLAQQIAKANADIVCMQEVCSVSFDDDFAFMKSLGYDGVEIYKKGRFRPATFWKQSKVQLYGSILHRDRCLISAFTRAGEMNNNYPTEILYVSNLHLSAGAGLGQNERRLRQINDCIDTIRKEQNKVLALKAKAKANGGGKKKKGNIDSGTAVITPACEPQKILFTSVIAGDMNVDGFVERQQRGEGNSAVDELLTKGSVDAEFTEDGISVTNKGKINKIGLFHDAYMYAYAPSAPPSTMVVEELYGVITNGSDTDTSASRDAQDGNENLSPLAIGLISKMFDSFATGEKESEISGNIEKIMTITDVEKWLLQINEKLGRGSEFRSAVKEMEVTLQQVNQTDNSYTNASTGKDSTLSDDEEVEATTERPPQVLPPTGHLTRDAFLAIYQAEIEQGKGKIYYTFVYYTPIF